MSNLLKTQITIPELRNGMTVEVNGELITVSDNEIKYNELFGYSFRGDGSKQEITRVQFIVPTNNGIQIR